MAQTLDHLFVNKPMFVDLHQFRIAHINSDFFGDVARGTSDHDPNMAVFDFLAVQSLLTKVNEAYADGKINKAGIRNSLQSILMSIQAYLNAGDIKSAISQLNAFINAVKAQRGKSIDPSVADQLIAEALSLIAKL